MRFSPWLMQVPVILLLTQNKTDEIQVELLKLGADEILSASCPQDLLRQAMLRQLTRTPSLPHRPNKNTFVHQLYILSQSFHSGIMIHEIRDDGQLHSLFVNETFARTCGYTMKECQAMITAGTLLEKLIYLADQMLFYQIAKQLLAGQPSVSTTLRIVHKDQSIRVFSINATIRSTCRDSTIFHMVCLNMSEDAAQYQASLNHSILHHILGKSAFDHLTDIYTKESFISQTRQMLDEHPDEKYLLVVLQIEHFRTINDLFGVQTGDNILLRISALLRRNLLGTAVFGRLHLDTFVFCIPCRNFSLVQMLNDQKLLCQSFNINYEVLLHNGLYLIQNHQMPIREMCDRAIIALSTVRDNASVCYAYYTEKLHKDILAQQQLLSDIPFALAEKQFVIYLQPVYSLHFNRPVSAEVLVRWQHPLLGLLAPNHFIPLFEKNFCIAELDYHIWELACQYLVSRRKRGLPLFPVSVNMSRVTLSMPSLTDRLHRLLSKYNLIPSLLRLEITESAYMDNPAQIISIASQLQEAGFKLLIDDFGNGYSSLNLLKDIPADILKIDRQFMASLDESPRAAALLLGIIRIAEQLHMVTIAEGVETEFQLNFLRTAGCDNIQGYYYAKPMPLEKFEDFLDTPPTI